MILFEVLATIVLLAAIPIVILAWTCRPLFDRLVRQFRIETQAERLKKQEMLRIADTEAAAEAEVDEWLESQGGLPSAAPSAATDDDREDADPTLPGETEREEAEQTLLQEQKA